MDPITPVFVFVSIIIVIVGTVMIYFTITNRDKIQ
jgi:hypothetical protein